MGNGASEPKKVAIIGGGPAGLSAAFHLVMSGQDLDITVYQLGWRLGGKGATGRNAEEHWRIEEHGIHGFTGFYYNAMRMLAACYAEVGEEMAPHPDTMASAMLPSSYAERVTKVSTGWNRKVIGLPESEGAPWLRADDAYDRDTIRKNVWKVVLRRVPDPDSTAKDHPWVSITDELRSLGEEGAEPFVDQADDAIAQFAEVERSYGPGFTEERSIVADWDRPMVDLGPARPQLVDDVWSWLRREVGEELVDAGLAALGAGLWAWDRSLDACSPATRERLLPQFCGIDVLFAIVKKLLRSDGMLANPTFDLDAIDSQNWDDWLASVVLRPEDTVESSTAKATVNMTFAYPDGDTGHQPATMSAASYVAWMSRLLASTGSAYYFFAVGTGESVILPLYLFLEAKGVRFEFFHKATGLEIEDGTVTRLHFCRQAKVVGGGSYRPLVEVKDLEGAKVWPNEPLWDQLAGFEEPEQRAVNFESWYGEQVGENQPVDVRGSHVVWAVPPGAWPHLGATADDRDPDDSSPNLRDRWATHYDAVPTTATIAMQLWLSRKAADIFRWPQLRAHRDDVEASDRIAGATYPAPVGGMADFHDLIGREAWAEGPTAPTGLVYLCDPMPDDAAHDLPLAEPGRLEDKHEQALGLASRALTALESMVGTRKSGEKTLSDSLYESVPGKAPGGPLGAQYVRANVQPPDRYVLAPPGRAGDRMRSWGTGLTNLVAAGDWIYTGLNVGSFEGAVMGGAIASYALTGSPAAREIPGFGFLHPGILAEAAAAEESPDPKVHVPRITPG